jgi:hypothetical protein
VAVRERRPIVTVIQFFRGERRDSRWPTTAEVRAMSYLAVVEGAQGLMYWSLGTRGLAGVCGRPEWCEERAERMNGLTAVVKEIADLEPALLAAPVQGFLEVTPPAVRVKVARVDGRVWVVAVNASSQRVAAQFVAQAALRDVRVRGDEGHALTIGERQWQDTLEAWDRRVYVVQ